MIIAVSEHELSLEASGVKADPEYTSSKVLVRLHGSPVGYAYVPLEDGIADPQTVRHAALNQCGKEVLLAIERRRLTGGQTGAVRPRVTVVVCTRDRPRDIEDCINSILAMDEEPHEILIVDNAPSDDATREVVGRFGDRVAYVVEPKPGLDNARNTGARQASGDVVAYTDDDVRVDPCWVRAVRDCFALDANIEAVTGLVAPFEIRTEAQYLFEEVYGGFGRGFRRRWTSVDAELKKSVSDRYAWAAEFGTGANMAFRRASLFEVGLFDPALDVGTATNGGGDVEMFFRFIRTGRTLVYDPDVLVWHRHREDMESLGRQIENNGVGTTAYLMATAMRFPSERKGLVRAFRKFRSDLRAQLEGDDLKLPRDFVEREYTGLVAGLTKYHEARFRDRSLERKFGDGK